MECEVFRQKINEDPAVRTAELDQHEERCGACAAYARRARRAEQLIQQALRFDVELGRRGAVPVTGRVDRRTAIAAIAAALVAGIAVWFSADIVRPPSDTELAAEVIAHWNHEPGSWSVTNVAVTDEALEDVLAAKATVNLDALGYTVSYARSCWVAGRWLPHLVVQSDSGPVMVLVVPDVEVEAATPLELPEEGLGGHLLPIDGGSIAVFGRGDALGTVEARVAEAVQVQT